MTRMFLHLLLVISFSFITGCTLFKSDNRIGADELDGDIQVVEGSGELADDFSEFDDLSLDDASLDDASLNSGDLDSDGADTFSDIEEFNEDLLEGELSDADLGTGSPPVMSDSASDDAFLAGDGEFDIESAPPVAPIEPAPVAPLEEDFMEQDIIAVEQDAPIVPEADYFPTEAPVGGTGNRITNLEYKSYESGGTVVISAEAPFTHQVREEPEFNQVIVEVADVILPESLKRPYIAKDFGQPVATINAYQDPGATTARFIIQYKNPMKPAVQKEGNKLLVMSSGSASQTISSGIDEVGSGKAKRVTIHVDDVEISEVIKLIAAESRVNIMVDSDVKGSTTVRLSDVPWDQALMTILKSHGLGYRRQDNILRIASQEKLAKEAENYNKQVSNEIDAKRQTEGRRVRFFPVNYADVEELIKQVQPFLTKDGKVSSDKRSNSLVVVDFVDVLDKVKKVITALDTTPLQILIEGKIVEAQEDFKHEMGMNLRATNSVSIGSQLATATMSTSNPLGTVSGGMSGTITAGTFDVLGDLTATLALRESENKVKVLSSPRVMVLNKEEATISQVRQVPVISITPVANAGQPLQQVTFQDITLSLKVTPQIAFNGEVLMDVDVQRQIAGQPTETGALQVESRSAKTKVLVPNGKTMVIGGIYQNDIVETETGVPYLKEIPILGYLFKSKSKNVIKNELLIFLTPKIVNPEIMKQAFTMSKESEDNSNIDTSLGTGDEFDALEQELETL